MDEHQAGLELQEKHPLLAKLNQHIPNGFDFVVTTLKGHLILEEVLDDFIRTRLPNPIALNSTRLTFELKIKFANALDKIAHESAWIALHKLNRIRNSLAHRLEDSRIEPMMKDFVDATYFIGAIDSASSKEPSKTFVAAIYFLAAYLSHLPARAPQ